ncbi:MAG: DUF3014 domain-containing protein [Chromatocurvus sp.]
MQADRNRRLSQEKTPQNKSTQTIVTAISVVILAVFAWLMLRDDTDTSTESSAVETPSAQSPDAEPTTPVAPDIPAPAESAGAADAAPVNAPDAPASPEGDGESASDAMDDTVEPPLTLTNSDARLREKISGDMPRGIPQSVLGNSNLVERGAAAIDLVRRGLVPDKLLNLSRPTDAFKVSKENGITLIDPESYRRYDRMVSSLVDTPIPPLVDAFQTFRPLLEDAYGALGYAPDEMDNALISALDEILATPVIDGPVAVERSEAVWAYAREELESLSSLQKQLLRTGPDNVRQLRNKARALRDALLKP